MLRRLWNQSRSQLNSLLYSEIEASVATHAELSLEPELLHTRLGRAGYLTRASQSQVQRRCLLVLCSCLGVLAVVGLSLSVSAGSSLLLFFLTFYGGACAYLLVLKARRDSYERALRFYLPLTIEQLILLVQSGLGPVPAIQQLLKARGNNPVIPYLEFAYRQAEVSMPFEKVLSDLAAQCPAAAMRHFLLHLETSIAQGASLTTSLRQLGDQVHTEWQLTLEGAVRRLESSVVFPVFVAVIGLLLIVAAVPIVPLLELSTTMEQSTVHSSAGAYAR